MKLSMILCVLAIVMAMASCQTPAYYGDIRKEAQPTTQYVDNREAQPATTRHSNVLSRVAIMVGDIAVEALLLPDDYCYHIDGYHYPVYCVRNTYYDRFDYYYYCNNQYVRYYPEAPLLRDLERLVRLSISGGGNYRRGYNVEPYNPYVGNNGYPPTPRTSTMGAITWGLHGH